MMKYANQSYLKEKRFILAPGPVGKYRAWMGKLEQRSLRGGNSVLLFLFVIIQNQKENQLSISTNAVTLPRHLSLSGACRIP